MKKIFNNFNKIGKGTYGHIYKFTNTEDDAYVIKEYIDPIDYVKDKAISMILYKSSLDNELNTVINQDQIIQIPDQSNSEILIIFTH